MNVQNCSGHDQVSIFVNKMATGWWLWIHNKHGIIMVRDLSQKMGFRDFQNFCFKLDYFLETMEMKKSLKKNLALKIMILHLLCDPMTFKEGFQSLEGIQDYLE